MVHCSEIILQLSHRRWNYKTTRRNYTHIPLPRDLSFKMLSRLRNSQLSVTPPGEHPIPSPDEGEIQQLLNQQPNTDEQKTANLIIARANFLRTVLKTYCCKYIFVFGSWKRNEGISQNKVRLSSIKEVLHRPIGRGFILFFYFINKKYGQS